MSSFDIVSTEELKNKIVMKTHSATLHNGAIFNCMIQQHKICFLYIHITNNNNINTNYLGNNLKQILQLQEKKIQKFLINHMRSLLTNVIFQ